MDDELLRRIAAELNGAPETAARAGRSAALVADTNTRIAEAAGTMPFDSTPYSMPHWLAANDKPRQPT
ncbi:MAG: hypothetical protein WC670_00415 [Pseudolabrys sp.]|jgi:hypothetical protein